MINYTGKLASAAPAACEYRDSKSDADKNWNEGSFVDVDKPIIIYIYTNTAKAHA